MTGYILIITIIHGSIGAVDVQRTSGYGSYESCAVDGVARIESQRELYPADTELRWSCQRDGE